MSKYFIGFRQIYLLSVVRYLLILSLLGLASSLSGQKNMGKANVNAMHWFRKGLRLSDNPALVACLEQCPKNIYPTYVLDGNSYQLFRCTPLRANFLVECLQDLDKNLRTLGSRLYVLSGDPTVVLPQKWKEWDISDLSFEEDETLEPYALQRDETIIDLAQTSGIRLFTAQSETLYPLRDYMKKAKNGKAVPGTMTGFQNLFKGMPTMKKALPHPPKESFPENTDLETLSKLYLPPKSPLELPWPRGISKSDVESLWDAKDCENLTPVLHGGETLARKALKKKLKDANWVATFEKPKTSCTSLEPSTTALGPYLSWGCLSPREVWFAIDDAISKSSVTSVSKPPVSLHGQLLWRDFNNLMAHDANTHHPGSWNHIEGNKYCREVPWDDDPMLLKAWKEGNTGYPWIDAAMRQLAKEGWIHHLGRHAVACFLTRGDLWLSWEEGAKHFEAQLLDADYSLNGFNWLWLSCSGFFYQYFRCYSPIAFQKKNDPNGQYIRKYVPELKNVPSKFIYSPWEAPASTLKNAGVILGDNYPYPLVDHKTTSKENMGRMKQAYDQHKERVAAEAAAAKAAKRSISSTSKPSKKKQKTK